MKVVLQRVSEASVSVEERKVGHIKNGLMLLLGIGQEDTDDDISWLIRKVSQMRIFNDVNQKMNLSIEDTNGSFLVISQFTLHASTKKGNRPSYINAAKPEYAKEMYDKFISQLRSSTKLNVLTGIFGADMKVSLINDGPVTILLDSKNKN